MESLTPEVIASIIGLFASIATAIVSYKAALRSAIIRQLKIRSKLEYPVSRGNFIITLKAFSEISEHVIETFAQTKADRFLILCAHNGKDNLRFASVIYEQIDDKNKDARLSFGAVSKYVNFEFDQHYRDMLKEVEVKGIVNLDVKTMPDCDLKYIYENEKIAHSKLFFINRIKNYDGSDNDLILYSIFATHSEEGYTSGERITMRTAINNIKIILKDIITNN